MISFFCRLTTGLSSRLTKRRTLEWILFYGFLTGLVFPVVGRLILANDIFKALYSGRYLWFFTEFPHHSTFTFNAVRDFLPRNAYNWLGNLILMGVFEFSGYTGLQVFRGLIVFSIVIVIHSLFDWERHPFFLLLFFFVVMAISQKLLVRTAIFAVPGITFLFWIGILSWGEGPPKGFWWFPLVLLIWSQLHGSYQLGLGVLILFLLGDVLDRTSWPFGIPWGSLARFLAIVSLSVLAVTFVKPYPDYSFVNRVNLVVQRFSPVDEEQRERAEDQQKQRSTIGRPSTLPELNKSGNEEEEASNENATNESPPKTEDQSWFYDRFKSLLQSTVFPRKEFRSAEFHFPLDRQNFLFVRSSLFLGAVGLLVFLLGIRKHFFALGLPFLALLVLGLGYLRTVGYLGIVPVMILAVHYRNRSWSIIRRPPVVIPLLVVLGILLGLSVYVSATGPVSGFTGGSNHEIGYGHHQRVRPELVDEILTEYPDQRFFNSYGIGSYLIWRWWPYKQVFVDTKWSAYHPEFQERIVRTPLPKTLRSLELDHAMVEESDHWDRYFGRSEKWSSIDSKEETVAYERDHEGSGNPSE